MIYDDNTRQSFGEINRPVYHVVAPLQIFTVGKFANLEGYNHSCELFDNILHTLSILSPEIVSLMIHSYHGTKIHIISRTFISRFDTFKSEQDIFISRPGTFIRTTKVHIWINTFISRRIYAHISFQTDSYLDAAMFISWLCNFKSRSTQIYLGQNTFISWSRNIHISAQTFSYLSPNTFISQPKRFISWLYIHGKIP